jgi:hypothetical protein
VNFSPRLHAGFHAVVVQIVRLFVDCVFSATLVRFFSMLHIVVLFSGRILVVCACFSLHSHENWLCYGCDFAFVKATVLLLLKWFGKIFAPASLSLVLPLLYRLSASLLRELIPCFAWSLLLLKTC